MTIEELKFEMYEQLAAIRKARKHPVMLRNFEDDLEAYLEALHAEYVRAVMIGAEAVEYRAILRDGYDRQCQLTHSACVSYRELEDEYRELRTDKQRLENANEQGYAKLQEATAKLAQGTESIKALHRVIKTQQIEQDRLRRGLDEALEICARDRASYAADIEQWGTNYDEQWDANQVKQKMIIRQRDAIRTLVFELENARKAAVKPSFWSFMARKKHQAKPLPKKTI